MGGDLRGVPRTPDEGKWLVWVIAVTELTFPHWPIRRDIHSLFQIPGESRRRHCDACKHLDRDFPKLDKLIRATVE
jgi:hypothetical protein